MVFGWLVGSAPESTSADASEHDASQPTDNAPETPAQLFVARAFRSLLVGTTEPETPAPKSAKIETRPDDKHVTIPPPSSSPTKQLKSSLSPSKPSGILLTPGTANGKRKSVSFGGDVKEDNAGPSRSGLPNNYPGKFPSPWTPKIEAGAQATSSNNEPSIDDVFASATSKTSQTTKTSERTDAFKKQLGLLISKEAPAPKDFVAVPDEKESATYWRNELEKHTQKMEAERKKLESQKQMVKSYARKKDTEANDLSVQLRQERKKVLELDAQVSYMTAQLAQLGIMADTGEISSLSDARSEKTLKRKADYENLGQITSLPLQPSGPISAKNSAHAEMDELRTRLRQSDKQISSLKAENQLLNADLVRCRESLKRQEGLRNAREQRYDKIEAEFMEQKAQFKQRLESLKQSHSRQVESLKADKARLERSANRDQPSGSCRGDCNEAHLLHLKLERAAQKHEMTVIKLRKEMDDLKQQQKSASQDPRSKETMESLARAQEDAAQWRIEYAMLEASLLKKERELERLKKQTQKTDEQAPFGGPSKPTKHAPLFNIAESDAGIELPSEVLPTCSDADLESGIWDGLDQLDRPSEAQPRTERVRPESPRIDSFLEMSPSRLPLDDQFIDSTNQLLSAAKKGTARQRSTISADRVAAAKARIAERAAAKRMMHGSLSNENQENRTP